MRNQQTQVSEIDGTRQSVRRRLSMWSLLLMAMAVVAMMSLSPTAHAQRSQKVQIAEFYVDSDDDLIVGSRLEFTVEGSPGAVASVRISGIAGRIPLKEVDSGVYEGRYTVKPGDRITTATTARATLKRRNRSTSSVLTESLGVTVNAALPLPSPVQPGILTIESLSVRPVDKIEAGSDLEFTMIGSSGGQASVSIETVASPLALREVKNGTYSGSYTVRRADRIPANARVTGSLVLSGRTLRTALNQPLVITAKKPVIGNLSPTNGERLGSGDSVSISATFDDSTGNGIDPQSVTVTVGGRDVTRNSVVTPQFFNYRAQLEPGAYTVVVTAKDRAGTSLRQSWQFTVGGSGSVSLNLPLELTSHQNMAQISAGLIELRGRTSPDASVDVQVTSVSAIFGMLGLSQNLLSKTVRADGNGNFSLSFQAPQMPSGGGRLQIGLVATKGSLRQVQNLVLMQAQ